MTAYYQRYYAGIQDRLEEVLNGLPPEQQLFELEKMAMKVRKANSERIYAESMKFAQKHPKEKEQSNDYKR